MAFSIPEYTCAILSLFEIFTALNITSLAKFLTNPLDKRIVP